MAYIKKINGYFVKDEEAREEINRIRGNLQDLEGNVMGHGERLDAVEESVGTHSSDISGLKSDYSNAYNLADEALERAEEAFALAEGRGVAHVFNNFEEMKNELKNASNTDYRVGEQLLIKEADVPDYWVSGIKDTNTGEYGHYEITILETQKVDLSGYATTKNLVENYATKSGTFPNMNVGHATSAGKVSNKLKIHVGGINLTAIEYDGLLEREIGNEKNPIANAVYATYDAGKNDIQATYATKAALKAENISLKFVFDSGSEDTGELQILKNDVMITPTT